MEYRDYYNVLGVERNATKDEIKRSYRKLALEHHPDHNPGNNSAEEKFKEINEAYQVLSDPEKKSRYDQLGKSYKSYTQHGGSPGNFNWEDWFVQNPRGGNVRVDVGDLGDIFGNEGLGDLIQMTPLFWRSSREAKAEVDRLQELQVTMDFVLLTFTERHNK